LQENVRLFMVPGMQHCGGGPGPNTFDTLTALENWVERGEAPDVIIASHSTASTVDRTMPLCKFPEQARYSGHGDVNDAANWSCPVNDRRLLDIGPNGVEAGLSHGHAVGHDDHHELAAHDFE
jgi:tannase/feruloyl esterase